MIDEKSRVDEYTRKIRDEKRDLLGQPLPFSLKVKRAIEGIVRRSLYGLLRTLFSNKPLSARIPVAELRSILIIPYGDAIGDLIVALPVARAIKARNPQCKVGMFVSERNRSLLSGDEEIDEQYLFAGRRDLQNRSELRRARRGGYEVVLNLHFTHMTDYGLIANYVGPHAIKATGFHERGELYSTLFNHISTTRRGLKHLSEYSLELLQDVVEIGRPVIDSEFLPSIHVEPSTRSNTQARVKECLSKLQATEFILVNAQASNPFREWGFDNLRDLDRLMHSDSPQTAIFVIAAPALQDGVEASLLKLGVSRTTLFRTSHDLQETAVLVDLAKLVITPDTAIVHFANVAHKPVVVFYPDKDALPVEWMPIGIPYKALAPAKRGDSVSSIPVSEVLNAVNELLLQEQIA